MGYIDDYVARLSPGERIRYVDLIAECRDRGAKIRGFATDSYKSLEKLREDCPRLSALLQKLEVSAKSARNTLFDAFLKLAPYNGRTN